MKVALITGAGRGLGKGFINKLNTRGGYFVYAGVRDVKKFVNTENIKYIHLDVSDDNSIQEAKNKIQEEKGKLDLLINNAGLNKDTATNGYSEKVTKLPSLDRKLLQKILDVNTISPIMMIKYMLPLMTEPEGFIINISSNRASFGDTTNTVGNYGYRTSKVGLNMMINCLLFDLPKNVSTFAVHPGFVKTDMNPTGILTPEDSAERIMRIIEHWKPELNGKFLNNDGSLYEI